MHNATVMNDDTVEWIQETVTHWLKCCEITGYFVQTILGLYFVCKWRKVKLVHPNLKILLMVKVTQYYLVAAGRLGNYLNTSIDSKDILTTNIVCMVCRVLHDTGLFISGFCPVWVSIERSYATFKIQNYEALSNTVGKAITTFQHVSGVTFAVSLLIYDIDSGLFNPQSSTNSCQLSSVHPKLFPSIWIGIAIAFCVFTPYLFWLYTYNCKLKYRILNSPLTARFQFSENIKALRMLVPIFMGYGLTISLAIVSLPYLLSATGDIELMHNSTKLVYQFLYLMPVVYGAYYIFSIFYFVEPMQKMLFKDIQMFFPYIKRRVKGYAECKKEQTDMYFNQLNKEWERVDYKHVEKDRNSC